MPLKRLTRNHLRDSAWKSIPNELSLEFKAGSRLQSVTRFRFVQPRPASRRTVTDDVLVGGDRDTITGMVGDTDGTAMATTDADLSNKSGEPIVVNSAGGYESSRAGRT